MLASHWALWMSTGSDEMSVFQMLSDGNIGHPAAPGTGVPARAGPASNATVIEKTPATDRTRTPEEASRCRPPARHDVRPRMLPSSALRPPALTTGRRILGTCCAPSGPPGDATAGPEGDAAAGDRRSSVGRPHLQARGEVSGRRCRQPVQAKSGGTSRALVN